MGKRIQLIAGILLPIMTRPVYVPKMNPADVPAPSRDIYAAMGEANIFRMLEDFYRELERSTIRGLFAADMVEASRRSAAFYVGLLGGPPLYHQRYGSPAMRARHMPFVIDAGAREVWLACFERVLEHATERYNFPAQHLDGFKAFLRGFSMWMVNTSSEE